MLTKLCAKCGRVMGLGSALCPACQSKAAERHKLYDAHARNKQSAVFYKSVAWLRLRDAMMMANNYQCTVCRSLGVVAPADEVHHIIPIDIDWSKRLDANNLVCLCHRHHMEAHAKLNCTRGD